MIHVLGDALQVSKKQYNRIVNDMFSKGTKELSGLMRACAQKMGAPREQFWQYFKKDQQMPKEFWTLLYGTSWERKLKQNIAEVCLKCCIQVSIDEVRLYTQEDKRFKNQFKLMNVKKSVSSHALLNYIP